MDTLRPTTVLFTLLMTLVAVDACRPSDAERSDEAEVREGIPAVGAPAPDLVDVRRIEPSIRSEIRYAGSNNFVGTPVDGYEAATCLLSRAAAEALADVQRELAADGLGVLVYDCYRPQRAVDHFVRWAADTADVTTKPEFYPNVDKSRLFEEGYIAERSGHSRGSTVDLTLVRLSEANRADGAAELLDMGTPYDFFDPRSHTESPEITDRQLANRLRLRDAMEAEGFQNYAAEWWHYTLREEPYPDSYFDIPIRPDT
ncbi:MAG: M15 family metallopeptidase [Gemmatimonadota bacterium]